MYSLKQLENLGGNFHDLKLDDFASASWSKRPTIICRRVISESMICIISGCHRRAVRLRLGPCSRGEVWSGRGQLWGAVIEILFRGVGSIGWFCGLNIMAVAGPVGAMCAVARWSGKSNIVVILAWICCFKLHFLLAMLDVIVEDQFTSRILMNL
jgi:hypothetical protein